MSELASPIEDNKENSDNDSSFEPNNLIESGTNDLIVPEATIVELTTALVAEKDDRVNSNLQIQTNAIKLNAVPNAEAIQQLSKQISQKPPQTQLATQTTQAQTTNTTPTSASAPADTAHTDKSFSNINNNAFLASQLLQGTKDEDLGNIIVHPGPTSFFQKRKRGRPPKSERPPATTTYYNLPQNQAYLIQQAVKYNKQIPANGIPVQVSSPTSTGAPTLLSLQPTTIIASPSRIAVPKQTEVLSFTSGTPNIVPITQFTQLSTNSPLQPITPTKSDTPSENKKQKLSPVVNISTVPATTLHNAFIPPAGVNSTVISNSLGGISITMPSYNGPTVIPPATLPKTAIAVATIPQQATSVNYTQQDKTDTITNINSTPKADLKVPTTKSNPPLTAEKIQAPTFMVPPPTSQEPPKASSIPTIPAAPAMPIIPFPEPSTSFTEEDTFYTCSKIEGKICDTGDKLTGQLDGSLGIGFLVEFTINDKLYKGFVLNAEEYSSNITINPIRLMTPTSKFNTHEVKGIEGLVELGRSIVADNILVPQGQQPFPKSPANSITVREPVRWECYFDSCATTFTTFTALTEHIKAHHTSQS